MVCINSTSYSLLLGPLGPSIRLTREIKSTLIRCSASRLPDKRLPLRGARAVQELQHHRNPRKSTNQPTPTGKRNRNGLILKVRELTGTDRRADSLIQPS